MPASKPYERPNLRDGVVTAVRAQKRDPERVAVFIDGEFAFGLAADIAIREGLRKGMEISAAAQARLLDDEERGRARQAALEFVAHRPRTLAEVVRRLEKRGFATALAEDVGAWLCELSYLDDAAYARTFVRERLHRKGHGPGRLRADLRRRGVAAAVIESALTEEVEPEALRSAAFDHAHARWQRLEAESDPRKRRKKVIDFLVRRGYDFDLIREAVEAAERGAAGDAGSGRGGLGESL